MSPRGENRSLAYPFHISTIGAASVRPGTSAPSSEGRTGACPGCGPGHTLQAGTKGSLESPTGPHSLATREGGSARGKATNNKQLCLFFSFSQQLFPCLGRDFWSLYKRGQAVRYNWRNQRHREVRLCPLQRQLGGGPPDCQQGGKLRQVLTALLSQRKCQSVCSRGEKEVQGKSIKILPGAWGEVGADPALAGLSLDLADLGPDPR